MRDNFADGRVYEAVLGAALPSNQPPTTSGIADVNVNVDAADSVIDLFAAFDDFEDPDTALTYTIENNSNPSLFAATTINGGAGTFTLNYAAATEGTAVITVRATDTGTPGLFAETTFAVTVAPFDPNAPVTIEVQVSASSDDAEERSTGRISLTSSDLELIQDAANQQIVGMRFAGLNIPPGAVIQNAYLQFQADETGSDPTLLTIHGQAIDSTPTFTSTSGNISGRSTTTASVTWSPPPWNTIGQTGPEQRSPNIAAVVQQIVSRPGWSSGNALAIIVSGIGKRTAESFNGNSAGAPLLHVEYVTGDPPANQPPTTSGIANVNLTVGDPESTVDLFAAFDDHEDPDAALTYSIANNSNPSLVTATTIDGALGTLTLSIAPGTSGTADIRVRATDTGTPALSVETTFTVTVSPVGNQPPTTTGIADVSVVQDAGNSVIDLFAAFDDLEDPDTALTYSIENNTNASLFTSTTINGVQGTITLDYAPAANGSAEITVRATDTGTPALSVATSFTVTVTPANSGNPITIEVRVAASSDDAEERPSGNVTLTSSDLELTQDKSNQQIVGMRFNALNIPPGASIQNAYLQFQADETGSDPTSLAIYAEAIDNAQSFISTAGNISGRSTTTAFVPWSPAPWNTKGQAGPDQQTPNIAAVIQEIVNRPGWSSGNSLAIIVTGTGARTAESYNGVPSAAPLLHVEFDQPLLLVQSSVQPQLGAEQLDDNQLAYIVDAGIAQISQSGNANVANAFAGLRFEVVDLPGNQLGRALPNAIQIDVDAAGFGWFVDASPYDNAEFKLDSNTNQWVAANGSPAQARVDLLTTVMHELGHVLGFEHSDFDGLMDAELPLGTRRLAGPLSGLDVDAFYELFGS